MPSTDTEPASTEALFQQIASYPWAEDAVFQSGISSILGSRQNPSLSPGSQEAFDHTEGITEQAKCFYYARKFSVSVDTSAYVKWKLDKDKGRETNTADLPIVHASAAVAASPVSSGINPATPYPASFTHIVELIMSGKPVPGVKDIPVTVLEGERSANVIPKRRKPWETG